MRCVLSMRERRGEGQAHDFMERLEAGRSEMASTNAAMMADLTQAMRPFWDGLDADQAAPSAHPDRSRT